MPAWVEKCIERYKKQGYSDEEAKQRCYGAYEKRKKKKKSVLGGGK